MDIKQLFSYQYLFQINGAFVSPGDKLFFFAGAVLVLLAIVMKIAAKLAPSPVDGKYRAKFYSLFLTIGLAELVWYGCRYQNIRFFGTHFIAWLAVLGGFVWLGYILISFFKQYKGEKEVWDKEQVRMKYLPK